MRALLAGPNSDTVVIAAITAVEVTAAVIRRARGGGLDRAEAAGILGSFRHHLELQYSSIEISQQLLHRATHYAENHGLRGYDAVQLAAAMESLDLRRRLKLPLPIMVCADKELGAAAKSEGFEILDPIR
jgi:predicted nucleic acid-binding protein